MKAPPVPRNSAFTSRQHDVWWQRYTDAFQSGLEPPKCWKKLALAFSDKTDRECETHYRRLIVENQVQDEHYAWDAETGVFMALPSAKLCIDPTESGDLGTKEIAVFAPTQTEASATIDDYSDDGMSQSTVTSSRVSRLAYSPPKKRHRESGRDVSPKTSSSHSLSRREQTNRVEIVGDPEFETPDEIARPYIFEEQQNGDEQNIAYHDCSFSEDEALEVGPALRHGRNPQGKSKPSRNRDGTFIPSIPRRKSSTVPAFAVDVTDSPENSHVIRSNIVSKTPASRIRSKTRGRRQKEKSRSTVGQMSIEDFIVDSDEDNDDVFESTGFHISDTKMKSPSSLQSPSSTGPSPKLDEAGVRKMRSILPTYFPREFPLEY